MTPGLTESFWDCYTQDITYVIPIVAVLLVRQLTQERLLLHRKLLWVFTGLAAVQIGVEAALRQPGLLAWTGNVMALATVLVATVVIFGPAGRRQWPFKLRFGLGVFLVMAVLANLRGLGLFHFPFNPEPLGFAVLMGIVGWIVGDQVLHRGERLVALDKDIEIARQIQTNILPSELPASDAASMAARYLPMTSVAGDFYDLLRGDGQSFGVLIADVSGHGVAAALIASMVKVAFAAQTGHADDPAKVLAGINIMLCGKLKAQFVTAAYVYVDLYAGTLRYGSAGHPAMLWQTGAGTAAIEANGLPLGLLTTVEYMFLERRLERVNRLLLCTDGVLEARDGTGQFFEEEGVQAVMERCRGRTAGECADTLLAEVESWTGGREQEDDLTVLVLDLASAK